MPAYHSKIMLVLAKQSFITHQSCIIFSVFLAPFERFKTLRVSRMHGIRAELPGNESAGGWAPEEQCLQQRDPREGLVMGA